MTSPHARTANEQRIASLEAEVVTLREALVGLVNHTSFDRLSHPAQPIEIHDCPLCRANRAIFATADYEGKVVVDKEELEELKTAVRRFRGLLPDEPARLTENSPTKSDGPFQIAPMKVSHMLEVVNTAWKMDNQPHLDSLRQRGKG